jgi:hypothetical protein
VLPTPCSAAPRYRLGDPPSTWAQWSGGVPFRSMAVSLTNRKVARVSQLAKATSLIQTAPGLLGAEALSQIPRL